MPTAPSPGPQHASATVKRPSYSALPVMTPAMPGTPPSAATSASVATPPLAITGTVRGRCGRGEPLDVGPGSMPSRAMSVMTNAAAVGNHCSASNSCTPLSLRPAVHGELAVAMVEPDGDRDHSDASATSAGSRTAALPITTRATPASASTSASATVRTPPPVCTRARPCDGVGDGGHDVAVLGRAAQRAASRSTTWIHVRPARRTTCATATGSSPYWSRWS
jgi:hypothetical protein